MEDQNSDDWLPPGWTVQVRVRKGGKRDKVFSCLTHKRIPLFRFQFFFEHSSFTLVNVRSITLAFLLASVSLMLT